MSVTVVCVPEKNFSCDVPRPPRRLRLPSCKYTSRISSVRDRNRGKISRRSRAFPTRDESNDVACFSRSARVARERRSDTECFGGEGEKKVSARGSVHTMAFCRSASKDHEKRRHRLTLTRPAGRPRIRSRFTSQCSKLCKRLCLDRGNHKRALCVHVIREFYARTVWPPVHVF